MKESTKKSTTKQSTVADQENKNPNRKIQLDGQIIKQVQSCKSKKYNLKQDSLLPIILAKI